MSDDLISKFIRPAGTPSGAGSSTASKTSPAGGEGRDDAARPFMLDLVLADGSRHAFPYAHLLRIRYDPSTGIELFFPAHTVTVRGRSLEPLYEDLIAQGVARVVAVGERYDIGDTIAESGRPAVSRIDVFKVTAHEDAS